MLAIPQALASLVMKIDHFTCNYLFRIVRLTETTSPTVIAITPFIFWQHVILSQKNERASATGPPPFLYCTCAVPLVKCVPIKFLGHRPALAPLMLLDR